MSIFKEKEGEQHSSVYKTTLWATVLAFSASALITVLMILFVDLDGGLFGKTLFVTWQTIWFGFLSIIFARFYEKNTFMVARGLAVAGIVSALILLIIGIYQAFFAPDYDYFMIDRGPDFVTRLRDAIDVFVYSLLFVELNLTVKSEVKAVIIARNVTAIVTGVMVLIVDILILADLRPSETTMARFIAVLIILGITGAIVTRMLAAIYKSNAKTQNKQVPVASATAPVDANALKVNGQQTGGEMNKEAVIRELQARTGRSERDCMLMNNILENHFLLGKNNKKEIVNDFVNQLQVDEATADGLYNDCCSVIMAGIFKRG